MILVASTFLAAIAPSGLWLMSARVVQGVGIAFLVNACLRAVLGAKPGRGAAMTYFGFAATVGGVFGLQSGGFLTEEFGWRAVFVLSTIIAGIITAATLVSRHNVKRGTGLLDVAPARQTSEEARIGSLIPPLVLNFMLFFNYAVFVALPLYTEHDFGASPEVNARLLMVITLVHLAAAFPAGRAIRAWGAQRALVAGMLIAMAGTALRTCRSIANLDCRANGALWYRSGIGNYGRRGYRSPSRRTEHQICGSSSFLSDLGLVVGPFVTGALSDAFGYRAPFMVLPVMMAIASLFALQQVISAGDCRI